MKTISLPLKVVILGASLLSTSSLSLAKESSPSKPATDTEKASYSIGQQIGRGLQSQKINVDVKVLGEAISDVLAGRPSRLSEAEMQASLEKMQEEMQKKLAESAKENKTAGEKYLAENKKKPGVKTTKSGLQYKIISEGKGSSPSDDATVKVHYRGTLLDGTEFDSSYKRNAPAEFPVGGVIAGWTEALKMMKPGAKWELSIPSDLAYGSRGRPGIPANSVLNFTVELVEVVKAKPAAQAVKNG